MQAIAPSRRQLAAGMHGFGRAIWRTSFLAVLRAAGEAELSLSHVGAVMLLGQLGEMQLSALAVELDRSVSATSRLVDQLLRRRLITRRVDANDRRARRLAVGPLGRGMLARMEGARTSALVAVVERMAASDQRETLRLMNLMSNLAIKKEGKS